MLEFELYVRNYRKQVLKPIDPSNPTRSEQSFVDKLTVVEIDTCSASVYHRAKIVSVDFKNGVCRVSRIIYAASNLRSHIIWTIRTDEKKCNQNNVYFRFV